MFRGVLGSAWGRGWGRYWGVFGFGGLPFTTIFAVGFHTTDTPEGSFVETGGLTQFLPSWPA